MNGIRTFRRRVLRLMGENSLLAPSCVGSLRGPSGPKLCRGIGGSAGTAARSAIHALPEVTCVLQGCSRGKREN